MMTRKNFVAVAARIASRKGWADSTVNFDDGYETAREHLANDLADLFAQENPNFDRKRFLTACDL